jgi:molybdopterin molybdotransferase
MAERLLAVAEAQARLLDGVVPLGAETVPLADANHRILAAPLAARRTQPPFRASAMDGYAVRAADIATVPARLAVVGVAPAGRRHPHPIGPGEALRIFTGAPVPDGADTVLLQENAEPGPDGSVLALDSAPPGRFIRPVGLDFSEGETLLEAGLRLDWRSLSLAAAMNHATVPVVRRPRVAILATGDELVPAGSEPGPDQIVASNSVGIAAMVADAGGLPVDLGIAADTEASIAAGIAAARAAGADILVTLGGASVGDLDLVRATLGGAGLDLGFWKVAMRPGKPLMFGRLDAMRVLGLPGNPVSGLVCALLFLKPLVRALLGAAPLFDPEIDVVAGATIPANDRRQDYLRARLEPRSEGPPAAIPFDRQDSSMLSRLAGADLLVIRPPHAPEAPAGAPLKAIRLG